MGTHWHVAPVPSSIIRIPERAAVVAGDAPVSATARRGRVMSAGTGLFRGAFGHPSMRMEEWRGREGTSALGGWKMGQSRGLREQ